MRLMVEANVITVFVGIESPNEASLRETKKFQNVRPGGTLLDKVHRIQEAGLEVWCGMILGFDHDDASIFEAQRRFVERSRIVSVMVGMLTAIPKTPLHARLEREGRLDRSDPPRYGTNVIPLNITREELRDGYVREMSDLYAPEAYFARMEDLFLGGRLDFSRDANRYRRRHPWSRLKAEARWLIEAAVLFLRLMRRVPAASLRREDRRRIGRLLGVRRNPAVLWIYVVKCAMHYHAFTMARQMDCGRTPIYNTFL